MIERGRYQGWRPVHVPGMQMGLSAVCITGKCSASAPPPEGSDTADLAYVNEWMGFHLRCTGHDLFAEIHRKPVRWCPPTPPEPGTAST
ncbi:hypothetical protein ACH41E_18815 [Streptomyces sp. NPDC020412]|uniref:hypothetical protein n=1 Tax=Streptomyces sp. NPDC020412 TaxID=3365073 RepID=UPI0037BC2FE7